MVAHHPHNFRTEFLGDRLNDRAKPLVCIRFAEISEVTGENQSLGSHARPRQLLERPTQVFLGRNRSKERRTFGEEVRVTDVGDGVERVGMLAELGHA